MKTSTRLACVVLGLLAVPLFTTPQTARADVEFSTFGPGQTYSLDGYGQAVDTAFVWADEFTPAFTGTMTSADFVVQAPNPIDSGLVTVVLFQNNPLTSTPLVSSEVVLGNITAGETAIVPLTLASTTVVPLVAGDSYWISLLPGDANTFAGWYEAQNNFATPTCYSYNSGMTYYQENGGASYFDVNATPGVPPIVPVIPSVPEPATWVMLIGGLGILAWTQRRRAGRARRQGRSSY